MSSSTCLIYQMTTCILILLFIHHLNGAFTPNINDYDAYGSKIAMNDILFVEVQNKNNPPTFLIQFSPYNNSPSSIQCSISSPDTTDHYVYTVAIGKNQTRNFFFAGELINGGNGTFIGVAKYNLSSSTCDTSFSFSIQYFYNYQHQEYYIIGVQPNGRLAYGFSNEFIFIFDSQNTSVLKLWNGSITWPNDSFMPHAVDITDNFGVISGLIKNPINSPKIYVPIIYLINFNSSNNYPIIIDQYAPSFTPEMWQDLLENSDADTYSAKYDMSVSINKIGNILVGMQFVNRVFLFSVNKTNPSTLIYISRNTNGRSIGNGKSIAWLDNGIAAILINTYSLEYEWSSSQIYFYDIQTYGYTSDSTPLSIFPNNHQILPLKSFSSVFLNIISSPSSLALLDNQGNILIFNPTSPGFYPFVRDIGSMPVFTLPKACLPGTYKNQTGVHDCLLCPTGTKNPGNSSTQCIPCSNGSFCSLGSVSDIPLSVLNTTVLAIAYPKSPDATNIDEVLIKSIFYIGSGHCLIVSPIFWTLIVAGLAIIVIIIMAILKFVDHSPSRKRRERLEFLFKHIDLIGEGDLWVGGLASFSVIVLVIFGFSFSSQYLQQYPIENSSDSYFTCDTTLRNAKFETSLQSLSIPVTETEQEMFDLLNAQIFYLNLDFVNTLIKCDAVSIQALFDTQWYTIRWLTCSYTNSILSLSIPLPYQYITVRVLLADIKTIGALRIGLYSNGSENERYNLKELNFFQSFSKYGEILAQYLPIELDVTKVINETLPLNDGESDYSGIYIPTFTADLNSLFLSNDQYVRSTLRLTTLIVYLDETPYYVKNVQQPIAKRSEVIFHNFLFTKVCLGIYGLVFTFYKLITRPSRDASLRRDSMLNIDNEDYDSVKTLKVKTIS